MEVVRLSGERVECAGHLAAEYQRRGGKVVFFGKPHTVAYRHTLAAIGQVDVSRILAVGDTLATDIAGAAAQGIASALVTGGVLHDVVGNPKDAGYREACERLFAERRVSPEFVLPAFNW